MAIFNQRVNKVLRFLLEENYSSLENLAILLGVPKQTVMRITAIYVSETILPSMKLIPD